MKTEHRSGTAGARWMLVAALVMLAAGSFYFLGYRPEVEKSANLASDHEEKRLFLQKTQAIVDAKRADLAAEGASADTAKREAAVPGEPDREGILLDLEQAAKSSGAKIQEVVFEEPGIGAQTAAASETTPTGDSSTLNGSSVAGLPNGAEDLTAAGFTEMLMRVNLRGTLAEVKNFAAALQGAERLYVVLSFEYGNEEAVDSNTSVFQLLAFYR
ncbi:MAG: hypothetical protein E7E23_21430 [Paenibacillus sp.]|uniref:hypothetical protein n=1 Tax=Paenibacillus sp. TaxID=58172 RepID=UPI002902C8C3|nr:hypothetical protein [Paenibacillus sp.]MDU2243133.1 hypothetical protein [Paenibacillus sp.]